jgi:hypothetical protein
VSADDEFRQLFGPFADAAADMSPLATRCRCCLLRPAYETVDQRGPGVSAVEPLTDSSVADDKDACEGKLQTIGRVQGVELGAGSAVCLDRLVAGTGSIVEGHE